MTTTEPHRFRDAVQDIVNADRGGAPTSAPLVQAAVLVVLTVGIGDDGTRGTEKVVFFHGSSTETEGLVRYGQRIVDRMVDSEIDGYADSQR